MYYCYRLRHKRTRPKPVKQQNRPNLTPEQAPTPLRTLENNDETIAQTAKFECDFQISLKPELQDKSPENPLSAGPVPWVLLSHPSTSSSHDSRVAHHRFFTFFGLNYSMGGGRISARAGDLLNDFLRARVQSPVSKRSPARRYRFFKIVILF